MSAVENVADVLDAAADLLAKPGAWTQGAYARSEKGNPVKKRRLAVCFCVLGAVSYSNGRHPDDEFVTGVQGKLMRQAMGVDEFTSIAHWNDAPERTQAEVVAKLREAAALARQEQAA